MKIYNRRPVKLNRNFHLITIDSDDEVIKGIKTILKNLNIPECHWDRYFGLDLTVYEFLVTLSRDGHHQINDILELIDEKTSLGKLEFVLGGFLSTVIIGLLLSTPAFSNVLAVLKSFLTSVTGLPVLGLIYTSITALYSLYKNQFDHRKPLLNRFRDNFFLLANTTLNMVAYGLWIVAATAMTPVIGGLFVAASAVDVVKEIFCLTQEYLQYKNRPPIPESDPLTIHQTHARHVFGYAKHRNALIINLVSAVFLVGIMAAWCFVPGGIFVTIAAVAAIAIVYTAKTLILKANEKIMRERLQGKLKMLEVQYDNCPSVDLKEISPSLLRLTEEPTHRQDISANTKQTSADFKHVSTTPASERPFFQPSSSASAKKFDFSENYSKQTI